MPGPRANLELAFAAAAEGNEARFLKYADLDPSQAPTNSPLGFLAICGVLGLGYQLEPGRNDIINRLRESASDSRWRIREAVALGLQHFGMSNPADLLAIMTDWSQGYLLERRAVVATLCEPSLLETKTTAEATVALLDQITSSILPEEDRRSDNFKTLRKTLGYGWSVVTVGEPALGKEYMEKWIRSEDPDILWIMKQNLKKKRLMRLDPVWTSSQLARLDLS